MFEVLVTCPPMLGMLEEFLAHGEDRGLRLVAAETTQVLSTDELSSLLPAYDGWIIGDDPATRDVFTAGREGRLRAAVKWGIGVDNVDFAACEDLGIPITNTPNMFGGEVADIATGYLVGLARETFMIDREIRSGGWPKPPGMSISGKRIDLSPKEFELLSLLASHPGKSYDRTKLLNLIWGYDFKGYEHTVNSHINRLRSKIEPDMGNPKYILTTWGVGYKFNEEL